MQDIRSFWSGSFMMGLRILTCLVFLGQTLATNIDIGENKNLHGDLKSCLSIVIRRLCPDCTTLHIVIPTQSSWETDARASYFFDSSLMNAITMYTMNSPGYEDPRNDQVGLYLVNTVADLKLTLTHLRETILKRSHVILVNFNFGSDLGNYLEKTITTTCMDGNAWGAIFIATIEENVQVFRTRIQNSGSSSIRSFKKLSVCNKKARIEIPQPFVKTIEPRRPILRVTVIPSIRPYVQRRTDDPGGSVGEFIKVLRSKFKFTPKYNWSVTPENLESFVQGDDLSLAFNFIGGAGTTPGYSSAFIAVESIWLVSMTNPLGRRNIFTIIFANVVFWHIMLFVIYISITMYVSRDLDKTRLMLRMFGMFLGFGMGWLPNKAMCRCLVLLWCLTSYVIVQAYLAGLTSVLSSSISGKSIQNAEDLMTSGIDLFCTTNVKNFYCSFPWNSSIYICKKCVLPDLDFFRKILPENLSMNKNWRPFALSIDPQTYRNYYVSKFYTVIPDRIGTWPAGIYTNGGAEFLNISIRIYDELLRTGIMHYWRTHNTFSQKPVEDVDHEILTMSHLNEVFTILYIGWACGIVIFVIELLTKWYHNN